MNRKKKLLRNILILVILSLFIFSRGLYFSPEAAYRSSERSIHYGPSTVVHVEDFTGGKYFLGKYDRWISCSIIKKSNRFFWHFGGDVTGLEINYDKPLFYASQYSQPNARAFGILNDPNIDKVEVHLRDGTVLTQREFYEDMFLITWESEFEFWGIVAYDGSGNVIFEEERLR